LKQAGISPLGLARNGHQEPIVHTVRGLKIALLAYTAIAPNTAPGSTSDISYVNPTVTADTERMSAEVSSARAGADVVVVVMHWGTEYSTAPDDAQQALARVITEAGADLVVGSHPHVAQGMQLESRSERSAIVAYSLGNALFDQADREETRQGLALDCIVDIHGVKRARLIPLETIAGADGYKLTITDGASGSATLRRAALSTPQNLQWRAIWDVAQNAPGIALAYRREENPGSRVSMEDFGLGAPTRIELSDGTLSVSVQAAGGNGEQQVWSSEPSWRVTGYTVGDANADGKPELIYTLWKKRLTWERPDTGGMQVNPEGGALLPHIYINGWRQGSLQPMWHGSPRPAPLLAVAVAPIGKGGKPLLATLESVVPTKEQPSGRLQLWEWTGRFGYELAGSPSGPYSEMWSDGSQLFFR
jgi:hypothetical protein